MVEGINVIQLEINYSNSMNFIDRSIKFIKFSFTGINLTFKIKPNLIFATSTPLTVSLPGIIFRWLYGVPFVFEVRDLWPQLPVAMGVLKNSFIINILKILENISYLSADSIIGLAPGICEEISKKNIGNKKISLIPNIADLDFFKGSTTSNDKNLEFLKEYDASIIDASLVAAFTGAHGIANGLENLIEVALELKRLKRNDIKILFIGEGSKKDQLINLAKTKKLRNCIFIKSLPKNKLAIILKESVDLGLMVLQNIPEFYNGTSPNKFFDYLACGLPVLNNYPGWLSQMIKENNLGIIVEPNNNKFLAKKLIYLADNKEVLEEMSKNCMNFSKKFNQELLSDKFLDIIEQTYAKEKERERERYYLLKIFYDKLKSIIDRLVALFLIIFLSPLFISLGIIVAINLGFPILFVQERPGLNNKLFKIIKFRSMKNSSNSKDSINDSLRINKFGKILRSTSLDELPELINILKGDMSFVGPRPLLKEYLPLYSKDQIKRHNVKPGITGYAQVKGRNLLDWEEKFNLDLLYIKNRNPILDIRILLITILKVISRDGINSKNSVTAERFTGSEK